MKLTIGIATMPARAWQLDNLIANLGMAGFPCVDIPFGLGRLKTWSDFDRGVEVLAYVTHPYDKQDEGLSYGGKRNTIMEVSTGKYVAFHDDDDEPHPEYIDRILTAIETDPDVVGFKVACYGYANGCKSPDIMEPADVSIRYPKWANDQNKFKYVRFPHHLAPTKREHAMAIGYRGHYGEDHDYSIRMQESGRLKTEAYIDEFMYVYHYNPKKKAGE